MSFEQFYASELISFEPGPGRALGRTSYQGIVLGPPDGRGPDAGGLDVLSLGQGGSIVLGFGSSLIVDDDGADFIVFENPFWVGGDSTNVFAELGLVEVSEDGQTWIAFPCDLDTRQGCAGWRPPLIFAPKTPFHRAWRSVAVTALTWPTWTLQCPFHSDYRPWRE